MTREEARMELIRTKRVIFMYDLPSEAFEAIDMAIEALSADTVSRETYHNLVTASNDIDRALREYQDKEENGELVSVVRCKDCRFWKNEHLCLVMSRYGSIDTKAEHYCSWGERKEK